MLSRLSKIKEVVTLSPDKIDKQVVCEIAVLLKEFESNFSVESVERRLFLTIIEKTLQSCWDSSNFRSIPPSNEIDSISQIILNSAGSMQFCCDDFWFGGRLERSDQRSLLGVSSTVRLNSIKFLSICAILMASVGSVTKKLGSNGIETIFQKLSESLGVESIVEIVNALMENDERCMYTLLALLEIQKSGISVGNSLDPVPMFLLLIQNIQFDTEVVVDWLQSETVAIPFLLRFFKALSQLSKKAMLEKFRNVDSMNQTGSEIVSQAQSSNKASEEGTASSYFSFEVEELHGEQTVVRHVQIPVREESCHTSQNSSTKCQVQEDQKEPFKDSFTDFVIRLGLQLEKLSGLLPFNVKPITRVLSSVEEMLEE